MLARSHSVRGFVILLAMQVATASSTVQEGAVAKARALAEEARVVRAEDPEAGRERIERAIVVLLGAEGLDGDREALTFLEAMADAAHEINAFHKAREARERLVEVYEATRPADHADLQRVKEGLAVTLAFLGEEPRSIELIQEVIAARRRTLPADHVDLMGSRLNLGAFLAGTGDPRSALAIYEEVARVLEATRPEGDPALQRARQNLAATLTDLGDHRRALAIHEKVLAVHEAALPAGHREIYRARMNLALTRRDLGDLEGAREVLVNATEGLRRTLPDDHDDLQKARQNLALLLRQLGNYEEALALQREDLAIRERLHPADHPDVALGRFNLAATLFSIGDYGAARRHQEWCLEVLERTLAEGHPNLELARQNLASTLFVLGDYVGARSLYEKVLVGMEARLPEKHLSVQDARANLGAALYKMNELEGARRLYDESLAIYLETLTFAHPKVQRAAQGLAAVLRELGSVDEAFALEDAALQEMEQRLPSDHPSLQMLRVNMAYSLSMLGDLESARELEQSVLDIRSRTLPPDHPSLAAVRRNLAWTLTGLGDLEALAPLLRDLAAGLRRTAERSVATSSRERQEVASAMLERAGTVLSLATLLPDDEQLLAESFAVVEQVRDLASGRPVWQRAAGDADPRSRALLERVMKARRELSSAIGADPDDPEILALDDLVRERDRLERELAQRLAERAGAGPRLDATALARALPDGACAVGLWRYGHMSVVADAPWKTTDEWRLTAHIVHADGRLERLDMGPMQPIEAAVERWRAAVGSPLHARGAGLATADANDARGPAAAALGRLLVAPLLAAAGDAHTWHVCLDDALHLVPLDALPAGEGLLGERVAVRTEVTFGRLLAPLSRPGSEPDLLALGGVDFDAAPLPLSEPHRAAVGAATRGERRVPGRLRDGAAGAWMELPGTRSEVLAIGELFRSIHRREPLVLLGVGASKPELIARAPGARYLHVATHGWFAPEALPEELEPEEEALWSAMSLANAISSMAPMTLCGLALAGANLDPGEGGGAPGVLTAEELAGLDLSSCELAVLSACDTHVGVRRAGQSIQSLQAALHAAGARTAVTSLWRVDDAATHRLFEIFYTKLWKEKLGKSDALWQAKMALRDAGHPVRDWAGWVLTGNPD
jgi:CHAT domain-containing protein